jgi:hypothetical protein
MSSQDSKLLATAVGAAAVGAALAVMALKMAEEKKQPELTGHHRVSRKSVLMNDFTDDYAVPSLKPDDAGNLVFPHNHEEKMRRRIATRYQIEDENSSPRESVTVRVPATSANVGPGCTCTYMWHLDASSSEVCGYSSICVSSLFHLA